MARLLILLACARAGAAGIMDALDIKAVCEVPADGPRKIYLDMDAEAFETLAGPPGPDNEMSLPIETTDCEPFKSAYINFSPGGHGASPCGNQRRVDGVEVAATLISTQASRPSCSATTARSSPRKSWRRSSTSRTSARPRPTPSRSRILSRTST